MFTLENSTIVVMFSKEARAGSGWFFPSPQQETFLDRFRAWMSAPLDLLALFVTMHLPISTGTLAGD